MKKTYTLLLLTFLLSIALAGCTDTGGTDNTSGNESDVAGHITEEAGSMADYIGWWQSEEDSEAAPFTCIEIPKDGADEVRCYDKNGDMIDIGNANYDEQRALNGNSLIVFTFSNIGEFGGSASRSTEGERWLDIGFGEKTIAFYYQSESPFNVTEVPTAVFSNKLN